MRVKINDSEYVYDVDYPDGSPSQTDLAAVVAMLLAKVEKLEERIESLEGDSGVW